MSANIREGLTSQMNCGIHDFTTTDIKEWEKHIREPGHFATGFAPCALCGERFKLTKEDRIPAVLALKGLATHNECVGKAKGV